MSRMTRTSAATLVAAAIVLFAATLAAAATPSSASDRDSDRLSPFAIALCEGATPLGRFRFPALDGFDFDGPFFASFNA
jgi:hypothetical protein